MVMPWPYAAEPREDRDDSQAVLLANCLLEIQQIYGQQGKVYCQEGYRKKPFSPGKTLRQSYNQVLKVLLQEFDCETDSGYKAP